MSRAATTEYIGAKRRSYATANAEKRTRLLNEVCETTGLSRKHVNRLLTGNLKYRDRKGRGKTYDERHFGFLKDIWIAVGCPCTTYLKAQIGYWVDQYEQFKANVPASIKAKLVQMSASTMDRALKGVKREKPGSTRKNRRSGMNKALLNAIERRDGEEIMACNVPPGDTQGDTVAMCGGDMSDNFWWICTLTDRKTQWVEIQPTWNRGQYNTLEALKRMIRRFLFKITEIHYDNGIEFMNWCIAIYFGNASKPRISRSRFHRKNDNAHVEQKNGSVVRELFGEGRLDDMDLKDDLIRLCEEWSDYCNFFRPVKMLISREKRQGGKGWKKAYDKPKTPFQRLLDENILSKEEAEALIARKNAMNGLELYMRLTRRLDRIRRKQESHKAKCRESVRILGEAGFADSALRAAPSGTSDSPCFSSGEIDLAIGESVRKQRCRSVEYLTNQKSQRQHQGVISI